GGVLAGSGSKAAVDAPRISADRLAVDFTTSNTATYVLRLQDALRAQPDNVQGLGLLGLAYQQRARETGDPAYYTKSAGVLARALRYAPNDLLATSGLGALALSRHRFRDALVLGRRAVDLSPSTARGYGVLGDAL